MVDVLYFGARPKVRLVRQMKEAQCKIIYSRSVEYVVKRLAGAGALVVHWTAEKQQLIQAAKQAGVPVLVITSRLADATAQEPFADLYLEAPAASDEVAALLRDMIAGKPDQPKRKRQARAAA